MDFNIKEDIIEITSSWTGKRFQDGRPKVPDNYIKALHNLTLEEIWKPIYLKGYESQFEGRLKYLDVGGRKLIGRAVTCAYCPSRPDLVKATKLIGEREGRKGTFNQWVVDSLIEGDVIVADMYDKIFKGTFLGGNLATAVHSKTKTGGAVIWGGIRDLEQVKNVKDFQVYYRGIDPTPIRDFCMVGFNTPTRIGKAICLPGDIVFGDGSGVLFIPSHLVQEVVDNATKTKIKDIFGFEMIAQNKWTTAEVDQNIWTKEMMNDLITFINNDERGKDYRNVDWSEELNQSSQEKIEENETAL